MNDKEGKAQTTDKMSEIRELAQDNNFRIRTLVTFNPHTPTKLLEELYQQDKNPNVRKAAKDALEKGTNNKSLTGFFFLINIDLNIFYC